MNDTTLGIALLALAAGLALGWFGALLIRRRETHRIRTLESELEQARARVIEKTRQYETYREEVNSHFQKTAELFHGLTEQYRAVYLHLARSAQQLVGEQPPALQADITTTERLAAAAEPSADPPQASAHTGKETGERPAAAPAGRADTMPEAEEEIVGDAPLVPELKRQKPAGRAGEGEENAAASGERVSSPAP
ncbi:MAG: DUF1043 family protein [Gammaproteobacteria bacterium]|nr:MAG: DUF1043 family protein [Gammaproteobacteria bacterium]